jgi:hypothetical protein
MIGLEPDIEPAQLVRARLVKLTSHIVSLARLVYELELACLAREPEHKKTI